MKHYIVLYRTKSACPLDDPFGFACYADSIDHAEEQLINAEPDADVVWVSAEPTYDKALQDYHCGGVTHEPMNTIQTETPAPYYTNSEEVILKKASKILLNRLKTHGIAMVEPNIVKDYLRINMQHLEHEEFWVLFLDNQHRLIASEAMFNGTIDGASVYPREVAKRCLFHNAAAVVFAHNHPSGISEPSEADKKITNKLKASLSLFDVRTLDHFIVGDDNYSFAEEGLI